MTPHHAIMIADGCPAALLISQKTRAAAWERTPPRPVRTFIPASSPIDSAAAAIFRKADAEERTALRMRQDMIKTTAKKAKTPKEPAMAKKPKRNPKLPATHPANRGKTVTSRLKTTPPKAAAPLKKPVPARKPRSSVKGKDPSAELAAMTAAAIGHAPINAPKPAKAKGVAVKAVRPESKLAIVVGLLTRKQGCTTAEILKATEWPAVSVPQQARAAGLTLRQEKEGKVTRYWGAKV